VEGWQFAALVSRAQWDALELIDGKSQQAARTAPYTGFEIQIVDTTKTVTEAVRTRAASGGVTVRPDGAVTYTPVWLGMFDALELEETGNKLWVIATLSEGSRTSP
jgi:hypothetical protein